MTLNERCAKLLWPEKQVMSLQDGGVCVREHGTDKRQYYNFEHDRNHSHLLVEAVREAGKLEELGNILLDKMSGLSRGIVGLTLLLTPAQISEAAREVLEQDQP